MASRFTSDLLSAVPAPDSPTDIAKALAKTGSSSAPVPPPVGSTLSVVARAGSAGLAAPAPPKIYFKKKYFTKPISRNFFSCQYKNHSPAEFPSHIK